MNDKLLMYPSDNFYEEASQLIKEESEFLVEVNGKIRQSIFPKSIPYHLGKKNKSSPLWIIILDFIFFTELHRLFGKIYLESKYKISYIEKIDLKKFILHFKLKK